MRLPGRALDRKLARELWRLRGQLVSIALVVATAVMTIVSMRGTYEALWTSRALYYRDYHLADVWASLERAPESLRSRILDIAGVSAVETRVTTAATLDLPWLEAPGMGVFVSVPEHRRAFVNDIHVSSGRYVAPGRAAEVVASVNFVRANELEIGDTIVAILNGIRREMTLVGTAISPEHGYSVPPGALYPDDERYGVFWMSRSVLGPNTDLDGAFNEVGLTLAAGANRAHVIRELDRLLDPYGGLGAYGREDQLSWKILNDELTQNRSTSTIIPGVFLAVAAFLLNLVLSRLIATQRSEIGTLKAFGYTDSEVGRHYLSYSLAAVAVGTVLGALAGWWSGASMVQLYGEFFNFPVLQYTLSVRLIAIGAGISLAAAVLGGWGAAKRATALPPAEAMRPEPPPSFRPGWLERVGIGGMLPTSGRFILRNMERQKLRSFLSSLGVAFSTAILVIGMFMFDGVERMMHLQFSIAQREDLSLTFNRPVSTAVRSDLEGFEGVTRVESFHAVPVRLRNGHREREVGITGLEAGSELRRIVSANGRVHPLPLEGMVLSKLLADRLHLRRGDFVRVEVLTGLRPARDVRVTGIVNDLMGIAAYMDLDGLHRLTRQGPQVSGAFLLTEPASREALNAELKKLPAVASVASPATMLASFQTQLDESLLIAVGFILVFSSIIAVAVIYNGTRIALSERGRELASLRVLGFSQGEVSTLLLGEQAVITLLAIPMGWVLGYWLASGVATGLASETYRIPLVVSPDTYFWSAAITMGAALASGLIVRRRLDRMDLISVLKTRE